MKTIEVIGELILNNEYTPLLLAAPEIQPFLTRAVQHQFDDEATRYFFDKKNRELFIDNMMLSASLYGDFGLVANLTNEEITAYKKRRDKLSDGGALFYSSPKDSDIIEIPRLSEEEWRDIFSKLLSEVGSSSSYHEQLLSNYSQYIDGSSSERYILHALMENIQDEVIRINFDYLITLRANEIIIGFLWENRLNDNKEDLFKGISIFEISGHEVIITNKDKMELAIDEEIKAKLDREVDLDEPIEEAFADEDAMIDSQLENDNNDDSTVSNWLWGISFFIIIKLIINYFNLLE